jgi:pimeloyl-ACP methyl ester carboxylesterase
MAVKNQSTVAMSARYTTDSVISEDSTPMGYRQLGHGPGVVVLHGAASSGYNHTQLAEALADTFTLYLPDRGRGLSGPFGKDYSVQTEVENLDALLTKTGAHNVFGVSSGAIIALQAALTLPAIHNLAIYEPPLLVQDPAAVLTRFDKEMAQGHEAAALVAVMKAAQMGPPIFNYLPNWLLVLLTKMMMAGEDQNPQGEYVTMRKLAPTLHDDSQLIVEMSGRLESFKGIQANVLLLGGSQSLAYLRHGLDTLEKVLPVAQRIEFPGLGHAASWNTDRGGQPEPVAEALRRFFV